MIALCLRQLTLDTTLSKFDYVNVPSCLCAVLDCNNELMAVYDVVYVFYWRECCDLWVLEMFALKECWFIKFATTLWKLKILSMAAFCATKKILGIFAWSEWQYNFSLYIVTVGHLQHLIIWLYYRFILVFYVQCGVFLFFCDFAKYLELFGIFI